MRTQSPRYHTTSSCHGCRRSRVVGLPGGSCRRACPRESKETRHEISCSGTGCGGTTCGSRRAARAHKKITGKGRRPRSNLAGAAADGRGCRRTGCTTKKSTTKEKRAGRASWRRISRQGAAVADRAAAAPRSDTPSGSVSRAFTYGRCRESICRPFSLSPFAGHLAA